MNILIVRMVSRSEVSEFNILSGKETQLSNNGALQPLSSVLLL